MGSLWTNDYGSGNTGIGRRALYYNTDGWYNTANGYWALYNNATGDNHTALGSYAGYGIVSNTVTTPNTIIGAEALFG